MKIIWSLFLLCYLNLITIINGYKILGVFPTFAKSHFIVGSAIMKGLAERGHDVTVLAPFELKNQPKTYKSLLMSQDVMKSFFNSREMLTVFREIPKVSTVRSLKLNYDFGAMLTNITFSDPVTQQLLNSNEKYDVVVSEIFWNEALLGLGYKFNAPIVGVSTFGASLWSNELVGTPSPPSYVAHSLSGFDERMTFMQRVYNLVITAWERYLHYFQHMPLQEMFYENHFPNPKPKLSDILSNVSLVLLNNHFSVSFPRPYVPNMIEVGGIQVNRKVNPLPDDIKKFLDSAKQGAVYFSMGSNLKPEHFEPEQRKAIVNTLKSLENVKVLFKWDVNDSEIKTNENILVKDWFPQDDVLAHSNIKLFITHGGLLSTTEAIYHGVPLVGIPSFADQYFNMAKAVRLGLGKVVFQSDLTEENLKNAVNTVLNNPVKFSDNVKEISRRYRDQPMQPMDTAAYWIEYVVRHKGAPFLRSAGQDLNFIQYHSLDVFAFFGAILFTIIFTIIFILKKIISLFISSKKVVSKKKTKTH